MTTLALSQGGDDSDAMLSAGELEDEGWGAPSTPRTPYTLGGEYSVPPSPAPPTPYSPAYQSPGMEQDYFSVPSPVPPGQEREQQQQQQAHTRTQNTYTHIHTHTHTHIHTQGPKLTLKLAPPAPAGR
jgi:hypothetical protein